MANGVSQADCSGYWALGGQRTVRVVLRVVVYVVVVLVWCFCVCCCVVVMYMVVL